MTRSKGDYLIEVAQQDTSWLVELRAYVRRLEHTVELARKMYADHQAVHRYQPSTYVPCARCNTIFHTRENDELCPYCLFREVAPHTLKVTVNGTGEAPHPPLR